MADNEAMGAVESGAATADHAAAEAGVVASQEGSASVQTETEGATGTENGAEATAESTKPAVQSRGENAHFKGLRKKAEALEGFQNQVMALARAKGLQPKDAAEAMTMLEADAAGQSHEDYLRAQAESDAALEARMKASPEYQQLLADAEAYRLQKAMADDLAAIRAVDPSVQSLEQLGEEFGDLIQRMGALDAYYYLKGKGALKPSAQQPVTGTVDNRGAQDRDFTSEELDQLSQADLVKDDKLFKKAMASMLKLGKK